MNEELFEELNLMVDLVASLVMDLDPETPDLLYTVGSQLEKIQSCENAPPQLRGAAHIALEFKKRILEGKCTFDKCTEYMASQVERMQEILMAAERGEHIPDADAVGGDITAGISVPPFASTPAEPPQAAPPSAPPTVATTDAVDSIMGDLGFDLNDIFASNPDLKSTDPPLSQVPAEMTPEPLPSVPLSPAPSSSEVFEERQDYYNPLADEELINTFIQSQREWLDEFEPIILTLEHDPSDEPVNSIKRFLHNAKGEAGALGLDSLSKFLHMVESELEKNKRNERTVLVNALLGAKDFLNDYTAALSVSTIPRMNRLMGQRVLDAFSQSASQSAPPAGIASEVPPPQMESTPQIVVKPSEKQKREKVVINIRSEDAGELIDFITETMEYLSNAELSLLSLETAPDDRGSIDELFRAFHNIKGIAGFLKFRDISSIAHKTESLLDSARNGRISITGIYSDLCFDSIDMLKRIVVAISDAVANNVPCIRPDGVEELVERLVEPAKAAREKPPATQPIPNVQGKKIGEVLTHTGAVTHQDVATALVVQQETGRPLGEILVTEGVVAPRDVAQALRSQKPEEEEPKPAALTGAAASSGKKIDSLVRVSTGRLDGLIDTVGELVIANAMVMQEPEVMHTSNAKLARNISHLSKITRELQELAMSMRMVSLKATFQKLSRISRDISVKSGQHVEFSFSGEETELDRNMVEEIGSPLVHLVRNAVDHGIETPDVRRMAGKKETGTVHISAYHEAGNVVIRIQDDGKGLDRDAIIAKASQNGIIQPGYEPSDAEIYAMIFEPGFSTAKIITDISGRGVGMDVVKRTIEALRGRIEIQTEFGKGTSFILRLPLTLAIIDGMLVQVGQEIYIIPTITILETLRPSKDQIKTVVEKGEMLQIRGDLLPLFRIHRLFNQQAAKTDPLDAAVVIITGDGKKCAILVDELIGQQQVVIKSLGQAFDHLEGISGGAILGDGRVALILDSTGLVKFAHKYA